MFGFKMIWVKRNCLKILKSNCQPLCTLQGCIVWKLFHFQQVISTGQSRGAKWKLSTERLGARSWKCWKESECWLRWQGLCIHWCAKRWIQRRRPEGCPPQPAACPRQVLFQFTQSNRSEGESKKNKDKSKKKSKKDTFERHIQGGRMCWLRFWDRSTRRTKNKEGQHCRRLQQSWS